MPAGPHCAPIRQADGMTSAAISTLPALMPGRPILQSAGGSRVATMRSGMIRARIFRSGAAAGHFAPRRTATASGAVTASPMKIGNESTLVMRVALSR